MSTVLLEKHEGFAVVTLNRPQSMNALSRELRRDFVAAFADCTEDPDIRVIILTGNGKAFCAGFDLKELGSSDTSNTAEEADNVVAQAMTAFEGPIIGAVNGHCITGGFEMAQDICGCVPQVLREYQMLIEDGYSMPLNDALEWEETRAIAWAKQASGAAIEERRQGVLEKGRNEQS